MATLETQANAEFELHLASMPQGLVGAVAANPAYKRMYIMGWCDGALEAQSNEVRRLDERVKRIEEAADG